MARPICSCGMVMYSDGGFYMCIHEDRPPQQTITSCFSCKAYHHAVDTRVTAEYVAERANHNQ